MGITPVVIPAMPLGYSVGFYRYFFNCHQMLTLSLICMTTSASTTVEIFFWRWQNIILPNSSAKLKTATYYGIWVFALTILFTSIIIIHYHLASDQSILKLQMKQMYSCIDFLYEQPGAWICESIKYLWVVLYDVVSCCIGGSFLFLFVYQSLNTINQMASNRSAYARQVQRKLLYLLCAQIEYSGAFF
ncbi:G_PROTEIN_RECEP_F1_2 domain-containing protein [Caenorhabditis elegans]|uniref:G_PROTEIN_RECEP_F1_2 domain-containing protein n=1 Tax=Caenorhabditis elegans TaxID=6239 RepID=A0A4V0IKT9_CAEEL|nr:G_PROTEIN_RECEP_F1_2 domain-containing protein [Caenorhabditis elegans]VTW47558.1 G_PROTEIN_RECEP_F1_2 domain-containing protein [Caenorhabditis elegans]